MKCLLFSCFLLLAAGCHAEDVSGVTNKVTEIDRDKDGKTDVRMETVYRGKAKVMLIMSRRNQEGLMVVSSRSYLANGEIVMGESDEDRNGTLETITVFARGERLVDMFTREPDGSVFPVSSQKLELMKKQVASADASLRELFDGREKTEKEIEELFERNQRKLKELK